MQQCNCMHSYIRHQEILTQSIRLKRIAREKTNRQNKPECLDIKSLNWRTSLEQWNARKVISKQSIATRQSHSKHAIDQALLMSFISNDAGRAGFQGKFDLPTNAIARKFLSISEHLYEFQTRPNPRDLPFERHVGELRRTDKFKMLASPTLTLIGSPERWNSSRFVYPF
jgi:hypothetical protein